MNKLLTCVAAASVISAIVLSSCASGKHVSSDGATNGNALTSVQRETRKIGFLQKVTDNAVYAKDISSKIDFTLTDGNDEMTVSGMLRMRRDEVIRIQLTPMNIMEVGRIEFTKDSVLIMDRINKEYVVAGYDEVGFLKNNGLDFYTLQSLFRNELFVPGTQRVKESMLPLFDVEPATGKDMSVTYSQGKFDFVWTVDSVTGRITAADITYNGSGGKTCLSCRYSSFTAVGSKQFPSVVSVGTSSQKLTMADAKGFSVKMKDIGTDGDWESRTTVSQKYKKVPAEKLLGRLIGM